MKSMVDRKLIDRFVEFNKESEIAELIYSEMIGLAGYQAFIKEYNEMIECHEEHERLVQIKENPDRQYKPEVLGQVIENIEQKMNEIEQGLIKYDKLSDLKMKLDKHSNKMQAIVKSIYSDYHDLGRLMSSSVSKEDIKHYEYIDDIEKNQNMYGQFMNLMHVVESITED